MKRFRFIGLALLRESGSSGCGGKDLNLNTIRVIDDIVTECFDASTTIVITL